MTPYIIRKPSTIPAPPAWKRWVTGQWTRNHVVRRGTSEYLGCVWKDKKGWRFAHRGGRFRIREGKYPSPVISKRQDTAAWLLWTATLPPPRTP